MKTYPTSTTSRTLDPAQRSFTTVVGKHDKRITDADVNLIQDLQDFKRSKVLDNMVFSGALQHEPFVFDVTQEGTFSIPAFDTLFNGEVVRVGGSRSFDTQVNRVVLPPPSYWAYGQAEDPAAIFVVYLEMWYRALNPEDAAGSSGYYIDEHGVRFIYANGCIECDRANLIADDVLDPFQGLNTTSRAQIQWVLRTARVPVSYDFTTRRFGLDPVGDATDVLFGQAYLSAPPSTADAFKFTNMGDTNGDFGLWRAGDGGITLPTLDGYTYAQPIAIAFQRNRGSFDPELNPHGAGDSQVPGSGVLDSGISGRFDYRYADVIYPEDVVDTRLTVSLEGYDWDKLIKGGFVDLINGNLEQKIGRGETPGSDPVCLGSVLPYTITISPDAIVGTDSIGAFDGFMNGFGSDAKTQYTVKAISTSQKTIGFVGNRWTKGDGFTIDLDATETRLGATISYVMVQSLVLQADGVTIQPVLLLSGQVEVTGLGTRKATAKIIRELRGTPFDPGSRDLYVTVGVAYEAGSSYSLKRVAKSLAGGILRDAAVNLKEFRVFGVSDYATTRSVDDQINRMVVYNPQYSNKVFGARAEFTLAASSGTPGTQDGISILEFSIDRTLINRKYEGLYVVSAIDSITKQVYTIRYVATDPSHLYVRVSGVPSTASVVFSVMLNQTAQLSYNSAVKAVTAINETITFGNYTSGTMLSMDPRVRLMSQKTAVDTGITTLVFATRDANLTGISGDSNNKFVFVADDPGLPERFRAYPILDVRFFNGITTVIIPATALVQTYPYFMVGSLQPAFSPESSLALTLHYLPYQGDGDPTHTYSVLHSEEFAVVTTNGTGAAPIVGLKDIYPYNRELPIVTTLPTQPTWNDAELANQAVSNYFGGNYEAKRFNNVEHTFITPLRSNDFIEPVGGWKRKKIQFSYRSGRGFTKVSPHIGFAITPPKPKATLGGSILSTVAPLAVYVNNVHGSDSLDGLTSQTPKRTIAAAVLALPPVLRHPAFIYVADTGVSYKMSDVASTMRKVYLGDGDIQSATNYCMAALSHTLQDGGRLTIARAPGSTGYPEISAAGFTGFGDGPSSAFVITDTRVVFQGLKFSYFTNPAILAVDSYVDFVDCKWVNNFISASLTDGTSATMSRCSIALTSSGTGVILSDSSLTVANTALVTDGKNTNSFYVCERTSNLTLDTHAATDDTQVNASTSVVLAKLNSTVVCTKNYTSLGRASLLSNSVLTRTTNVTPFGGGITQDSSSLVMTDVS